MVGAGPVGLGLALGLARCGVRSLLLERRTSLSEHSKAPGLHVRTREVLRRWDVEDALLAEGRLVRRLALHRDLAGRQAPLLDVDFTELADEAEDPGLLVLEQDRTERLLLEALRATGCCEVRLGAEVVDVVARSGGASVSYDEDGVRHAVTVPYVVGCDGASSVVRERLGLGFDGITYTLRPVLADVRVTDARDRLPWPQVRNARRSLSFAVQLRPGLWRIVALGRGDGPDEPDAGEVAREAEPLLGPGPCEVAWASRFRIHRRSAPRFRVGPVLLAGDAAHVHSPVGGQGMNGGLHDAADLAWKLARALEGGDGDRLLDAYDTERRGVVVGSTSRYTDLVTRAFLLAPASVRSAAFAAARAALRIPRLRRRGLRRAAMLDLRYRRSPLLPGGAPPAGVRLPDPVLRVPGGGSVRLHRLTGYRPALVECRAGDSQIPEGPVPVVRVTADGHREPAGVLARLLGGRDGWLLVRPDGHVARAGRAPTGPTAAEIQHALG